MLAKADVCLCGLSDCIAVVEHFVVRPVRDMQLPTNRTLFSASRLQGAAGHGCRALACCPNHTGGLLLG